MMSKDKCYVLVDKFGGSGGAPQVIGPFTYDEADALLRQGAAIVGDYCPNMGYWSDLPGWDVRDDYSWLMRKIKPDFSVALQEARDEIEEY